MKLALLHSYCQFHMIQPNTWNYLGEKAIAEEQILLFLFRCAAPFVTLAVVSVKSKPCCFHIPYLNAYPSECSYD